MNNFFKNWYLSLFFFFMYLTTFHLWNFFQNTKVDFIIGLSSLSICLYAFIVSNKKSYFSSKVDRNIHFFILIDICLETFIYHIQKLLEIINFIEKDQDFHFRSGYDFYVCAFTFAIIIGRYRYVSLKKKSFHT